MPRRDASARREALISAAEASFREAGYGVPLEAIADRAGVGRGTLYRNFADREALAIAIFSREIDRIEDAIDPGAPLAQTLRALVGDGAAMCALFNRIASELELNDANLARFKALGERMCTLVEPAVLAARARGEIDPARSPFDLVLALRMVGGLMLPFHTPDEVDDQINAALSLVLDGLRPR